MSSDVKPFGVAVIGSGPWCHFALERLALQEDFEVLGWHGNEGDHVPTLPAGASIVLSPLDLIGNPRTTVIYLAGSPADGLIAAALEAGKHVVLPSVAALSSAELGCLAQLASRQNRLAVLDQSRSWTDEAQRVRSTLAKGDLGSLRRIRLEVHETSLPGDVFRQGVLRELGWHWLDQLLAFVSDTPCRVQLRTFSDGPGFEAHGFLTMIEFTGGANAVIELQTQSLLSLRSGWLLEGTLGAYRDGRKYTKTADGEIVDEALDRPSLSSDPFFETLASALRGDSAALSLLPDLHRAERTARLIEMLEQSGIPHESGIQRSSKAENQGN